MTRKRCSKCGIRRLVSKFCKDKTKKDGLSSRCKVCMGEANKVFKKTHIEQVRASGRRRYHERAEIDKNSPLKPKTCTKCKIIKICADFYAGCSECKECELKYQKQYYKKEGNKIRKYHRDLYWSNPEKHIRQSVQWAKNNPEKVNAKHREWAHKTGYGSKRLKTNVQARLAHNLRGRLRMAIKNNQKVGSAVRDLGCSIDFLKTYLESKFKSGMSWDNYGFNGWHIDHIIPLNNFELTIREEFLVACHYTNLQPLWKAENLSKGIKLVA